MDLFRIIQDAAQVGAGGEIQAEQMADKMPFHRRLGVVLHYPSHAIYEFVLGDRQWVAFPHLETCGEAIAQQGKWLLHVRAGAGLKYPCLCGDVLQPGLEFIHQAALAHPGLAYHAHQARAARL